MSCRHRRLRRLQPSPRSRWGPGVPSSRHVSRGVRAPPSGHAGTGAGAARCTGAPGPASSGRHLHAAPGGRGAGQLEARQARKDQAHEATSIPPLPITPAHKNLPSGRFNPTCLLEICTPLPIGKVNRNARMAPPVDFAALQTASRDRFNPSDRSRFTPPPSPLRHRASLSHRPRSRWPPASVSPRNPGAGQGAGASSGRWKVGRRGSLSHSLSCPRVPALSPPCPRHSRTARHLPETRANACDSADGCTLVPVSPVLVHTSRSAGCCHSTPAGACSLSGEPCMRGWPSREG